MKKLETIGIRLTPEERQELDENAEALGWTRSKLAAVMVESCLTQIREKKKNIYSFLPSKKK